MSIILSLGSTTEDASDIFVHPQTPKALDERDEVGSVVESSRSPLTGFLDAWRAHVDTNDRVLLQREWWGTLGPVVTSA